MLRLVLEMPILYAYISTLSWQYFPDEDIGVVSTHYVVNGVEVILPDTKHDLPVEQHGAYQWLTEDELMASNEVAYS